MAHLASMESAAPVNPRMQLADRHDLADDAFADSTADGAGAAVAADDRADDVLIIDGHEGDDEQEDVEDNAAETAPPAQQEGDGQDYSSPPIQKDGDEAEEAGSRSDNALMREHLISFAQQCLTIWKKREIRLFETVLCDPRVSGLGSSGGTQAKCASKGSPNICTGSSSQEQSELATARRLQEIVLEATALAATGLPTEDGGRPRALEGIKASLESDEHIVAGVSKWCGTGIQQWWTTVLDKASNHLSSTHPPQLLKQAFAPTDETDALLTEQFKPLRQELDQLIQASLRPAVSAAVSAEVSAAFRQGAEHLEGSVDEVMRECAATLSDGQLLMAAQRLLDAKATSAGTDGLSETVLTTVRNTCRPVVDSIQTAPAKDPNMAVQVANRKQEIVAVAMAALDKAAAHIEESRDAVRRCTDLTKLLPERRHDGAQKSPERRREQLVAARQATIRHLCTTKQFEEALEQAVQPFGEDGGEADATDTGGSDECLVEWACREVLVDASGGDEPMTPEEFCVAWPPTEVVAVALLSSLLKRATVPDAPLQRVEAALEWALALSEAMEPSPLLSSGAGASATALNAVVEALAEISGATPSPECLVTAPAAVRQRISRSARMASKQLAIIQNVSSAGLA
eukprot:TRINITY_DN76068_c0_g1_i1.p1 TRINITY_DN76068_c0_g1~~TRINITY_DN76068_c0_g1_i1.p1  ORF type:complete len:640 (+),score=134.15 TRINITY_DN76068_c0_g1_i1:25-1920(+)